jgi:hypothetical protein
MLLRSSSQSGRREIPFVLRINSTFAMLFSLACGLLPLAALGGILGAKSSDIPWKSRVTFAGGSVLILILWSLLLIIIQRRWVRFEVSRAGIREVRWLGPPRELA